MIAEGSVRRLTAEDVAWDELVPGMHLARSITAAGSTQLGGGYMRYTEDADFGEWTLKYDEVLFVQKGELEVIEGERSTVAREGEAILIPKGATVTYRGKRGTAGFYVLWPFDWDQS
jgi:ethanolamine utilization protein EutQ (cupin superfamily)